MKKENPLQGVLLISDMDGTLITKEFRLPDRNIKAINRFTAKGGLFALATGRSDSSASKYIDHLEVNAPSILYNGAAIYDFEKQEYLWDSCLPEDSDEMLRRVMERFPDIGIEIFVRGMIYIVSLNEWVKRHLQNETLKYEICPLEKVPRRWNKYLFAAEHSRLVELQHFLEEIKTEGMDFVFSNTMYFEALPSGVSKGTTLRKLADLLEVKQSNVMAIGDFFNDMELITEANLGAVPAGAPEELKAAADVVVGDCENGAVADFIEYIERKYECC